MKKQIPGSKKKSTSLMLATFLLCFVASASAELPELTVAGGLEATLFANESQLFNPVSIDVDDRGRVWVLETVNYRKKTRTAGDRILILEDSTGDGKADKKSVFYQDHDIDGGHGICVLGERVIVSAPDRILQLTDTDGDGRSDSKKLMFKGKVTTGPHGQHDHAIHAVMFGPDGRLYFNFGNYNAELRREDGTLVKDVFGQPVNNSRKPYMEGMVIRCELDGSRVEVLGYNFRNNWEVTVDSFGSMWQSDNDNGSSSCRVNFVMEYGNYGYRDEVSGLGYQSERTNMSSDIRRSMWHQNDPGVVPNLLITGSGAPTGILVYEGNLLPEKFRGQMIHAETGRNVVWSFPVKKSGAGYTASITNLVHSEKDRMYRPSDLSVAPDGSLIIADWYDPVDCCHRTLDDTGRIIRVAPPGHAYSIPKYDFDTPGGAVKALQNPNLSVRYKAWMALKKMGQPATQELKSMAKNPNPRFRARALWALAEFDTHPHEAITLALGDKQDDIRALALRIARRHRVPVEDYVEILIPDTSPLVRRECAVSLHRRANPAAAKLWANLAHKHDGKDRWYLEALGLGETGYEGACFSAWLGLVGDRWDTAAGRDIIWRSRAPEATAYLAKLLVDPATPESERPRLMRALDFHQDESREAALLTILSSGLNTPSWVFLETFQRVDPAVIEERPELSKRMQAAILESKGTTTFVDLVARFDRKDLTGHLMDMVVASPGKLPGIRALGLILAFGERQRVVDALADRDQAAVFIEALGKLGTKDSVALVQRIVSDDTRPLATRALAIAAMGHSSPGASSLMRLVQKKSLPSELLAPAVRSLSVTPGPGTRAFAAEQFDLLALGRDRWPLEKLLAAKPDVAQGKSAFGKAGCGACHVVQDEGIDFGPNLSDIATKLSQADLFSAILNPNQTIALGFGGLTVELKDGSLHSGYLTGESETTLSLRSLGGLQNDLDVSLIKSRQAMEISLMPAGLDSAISSQELVDLVGWLATLKAAKIGRTLPR